MELREPPPGWKFAGETKDGLWAKFWSIDPNWKPAAKPKQWEPKPETKTIVPDSQKDKAYRAILGKLTLSDRHLADFHRRGLSPDEIEFLAAKARSLVYGYLIPFPSVDGLLCGAQVRRDDADRGRYRHHYYRDDVSLNNEFNEKPLAVWRNGEPVWIVEGTGVKPIVASIRHSLTAIGASGGLHHISPKTLAYTLEKLGNPASVVLCPDAGDIQNQQVMSRIRRNIEALGVQVTIAWWGQKSKADQDIDEIPNLEGVRYLSPAEFWAMVPEEFRSAPIATGEIKTKPKSKAQQQREWRAIQADRTRKAILKPFGDRQYDIVCHTTEELVEALLTHTHCFIDGPTGSGKTEAMAQLMKLLEGMNLLYFSPVRSLAKGAAKTTGLPYFNDYAPGELDGCTACIHSAHKVFMTKRLYDADCIFLDEVEQCLEAQIAGDLCMENRAGRLGMTNQGFREALRLIASSATAALKDLNYLETVTEKKFTLILFDPRTHKKGKFKMITGQPGVKGSDRAAKAMLMSKIGDRQHFFTDSLRKTIDYGIRLEEQGVTHEIVTARTANEKTEVKDLLNSPDPGQHLLESGCSSLGTNPAVQSGFSIKNPEGVKVFNEVLGYCTGGSVSPGTAFQGLGRYRDNCDRSVYAPNFAKPRSKLCRGRAPRGFGSFSERQKKQWDTEHEHLEQQVRSGNSSLKGFEMLSGTEKEWYREYEIQMDREFRNFAVALAAYAERDGYAVEWVHPDKNYIIESKRDEVFNRMAKPIAEAKAIDTEQFKYLIEKPEPTQAELDQIDAYLIRDYFGLGRDAPLTKDLVVAENFGEGRKALKHALRLLWDGQASADDAKRTEKLGYSGFLWDTTNYALSLHWWTLLEIDQLLAHCMKNPYSSLSPEIREFGDRLSSYESELGEGSRMLGVPIPAKGDDTEAYYALIVRWIGMQLKRLGISTQSKRVRGEDGKLLPRVYQVIESDIAILKAVLRFKLETQLNKDFQPRSTPLQEIFYFGVDLKLDDSSPPLAFVDFYRKRLEKIYGEALQGDDIPLIERIGLELDKAEAFI